MKYKYIVSSIISGLVDIIIFTILKILLKDTFNSYILISSYIARIISCLVNYKLNKDYVFKSNNRYSFIKYIILVFINITISGSIVTVLYNFLNLDETIIKVFVDIIIFIFNYLIQRLYIFKK